MGTAPARPQFTAHMGGARPEPDAGAAGAGGPDAGARDPASQSLPGGGAAFVIDPSMRCLVADGDAIHFAGLDPADVVGRPLAEVLEPQVAASLEPHCRLALAGHTFAHAHEAHGRACLSRGVPLHGEAGAIHGALIVIYDLTPIREAERALMQASSRDAVAAARLHDSEARLTLALEASGMGTFVWHLDEHRGEPDARALELFGLDDAAISLEDALDTLIPADDRARCAAVLARALDPDGSGTLQADIRVRRPHGGERWLAITARATFAGEPRRAVRLAGVVADIDDRKRAEASLRAREAALTGADRAKDEFLAVLAHELRNPLAPIRAGLELLRLSGNTRDVVDRTRGIMERQVGHMVRLIDDLLDVSRITSGKIQLDRRPTPLDTLVGTAVEANREAISAARVQLEVALPDVAVWLDVDPTRLVQVISNVLHNAVKFTDAGGRIAVTGTVDAEPAEAGRADGGARLALAIADSGIGISPAMQPRIFDLFTQDRAGSSRSHGGLGIGLALARRLIEMHGGTIEARSDGPGRGSVFTIRLPVGRPAADRPPPAPPDRTPASRTRHRVVVVDDNLDAANAMAMLVTALGGEARVAGDGASGLAHVLDWSPTLVLLDIGMPGMDGYETCRRIREAVGPRVVVVAVTGWGQEQHKRDAERAGFDAHLTKPADPGALERLLAEAPRES
jgi:PAS domain S-box-containing protein